MSAQSVPNPRSSFGEYIDSEGCVVRYFNDYDIEAEAEERLIAELELRYELEYFKWLNDCEAKRTDNWNINSRFTRRLNPEHPRVIQYGLRINKVGSRGLRRRL